MEINRRFIVEKPLGIAGYRVLAIARIYTSWTIGRGGIYAFFDKQPVLVVMKPPSGEVTIMDMNGSVLTPRQAMEMFPDLKQLDESIWSCAEA